MRIGILGLWGMNVPGVTFGGFETAYSEIGAGLAQKMHDVVIYCRRERYPKNTRIDKYRGVRLKYVPSIDTKNLSGLTATWMAVKDSLLTENFDVYLFVNVGMGFHCQALKILRKKVVVNVDGLDWQRAKWSRIANLYFQLATRAAVFSCDEIIADSRAIQEYYVEKFKRRPVYISYGAHIVESISPSVISKFGVKERDYLLIVSRFVPENNLHILIEAFEKISTHMKLLVVGGTNHPTGYEAELRKYQSERIIFAGYISDRKELNELFCNCYAYLHGHSVGGTNPVLLDALGAGCCIIAVNTPFNAEVLAHGQFGVLFDLGIDSARKSIEEIICRPKYADHLRENSKNQIQNMYNWESIIDEYEVFLECLL